MQPTPSAQLSVGLSQYEAPILNSQQQQQLRIDFERYVQDQIARIAASGNAAQERPIVSMQNLLTMCQQIGTVQNDLIQKQKKLSDLHNAYGDKQQAKEREINLLRSKVDEVSERLTKIEKKHTPHVMMEGKIRK